MHWQQGSLFSRLGGLYCQEQRKRKVMLVSWGIAVGKSLYLAVCAEGLGLCSQPGLDGITWALRGGKKVNLTLTSPCLIVPNTPRRDHSHRNVWG